MGVSAVLSPKFASISTCGLTDQRGRFDKRTYLTFLRSNEEKSPITLCPIKRTLPKCQVRLGSPALTLPSPTPRPALLRPKRRLLSSSETSPFVHDEVGRIRKIPSA